VNLRRTQILLTAVGMAILGAMEVYIPSAAETSDTTTIFAKDFMFNPSPLTVKAGSTVTWINKDDEPHTVVSDAGIFKSGGMDTNESFSHNSTNRVHTTSRARSIRAWSVRSSFSSLMKSSTKTSLVASVSIAALAVAGGALFIGSGVYDIGADDHHTKLVLAVIERLRDHSIEARTRRLEVHTISDPARLATGAQHYAALCVSCHLAPGVTKSDIRPGLLSSPTQPRAGGHTVGAAGVLDHQTRNQDERHARLGKTLDDAAIWDLVAFVRKLPEMTPETYAELSNAR